MKNIWLKTFGYYVIQTILHDLFHSKHPIGLPAPLDYIAFIDKEVSLKPMKQEIIRNTILTNIENISTEEEQQLLSTYNWLQNPSFTDTLKRSKEKIQLRKGDSIFHFVGIDSSNTTLHTEQFDGKKRLLYFYETTNYISRNALLNMLSILYEQPTENWRILAINMDSNLEQWKGLVDNPTYYDYDNRVIHLFPENSNAIKQAYNIETTPRLLLVDENGRIEWMNIQMLGLLDEIFAELIS